MAFDLSPVAFRLTRLRGLILGGTGVLLLAFVLYVIGQDHPLDVPCPVGPRSIRPTEIHLTPSILQHQSWVGIPPSEIRNGDRVVVCTDGLAIGRAIMDPEDVAAETVELDIPTRWVALTWASGRLDAYQDGSRWTVILPPFTEVH